MNRSLHKAVVFLLISFAFASHSQATHISGMDISYKYIGDSTGVPHQYEFSLRLYRDNTGAVVPYFLDLRAESSCFVPFDIRLQRDTSLQQGLMAPTLNDCVDVGPSTATKITSLYFFKGVHVLPGTCGDFRFSYYCGWCRNSANNAPPDQHYLIRVFLNNSFGPNSSPVFVSEPVRAFCVDQSIRWKQIVLESDGDSIRYSLTRPLALPNPLPNGRGIIFNNGFTFDQPFMTNPPRTLILDEATGLMTFSLDSAGLGQYTFAIMVEEYRYDSINESWFLIGTSIRDMQITVATICNAVARAGVSLNTSIPGTFIDWVTGYPTVMHDCRDNSIMLHFNVGVDCETIARDGSDFRMVGPDGRIIPIKGLVPDCGFDNASLTILVELFDPFELNGTYFLYSKAGTDGNTLYNKCGFDMPEYDTLVIRVGGCFKPKLDMQNVTIYENQYPIAHWIADTTTFPIALFERYEVYRSDGGPFTLVGSVSNVMQWAFQDLTGDPQVDYGTYSYQIELVANDRHFEATRFITSILLESDQTGVDTNRHYLTWNAYDGWDNPEYRVMLGFADGVGGYNFVPFNHSGNPTAQTWFEFEGPYISGKYAIRVDALNPASRRWEAASNWIEYDLLAYPSTLTVPNVITPNGDGINDFFVIEGIENFARSEVLIFNRWGQQVFERANYVNAIPWGGRDMQGNLLADGVYFYVIRVTNQTTQQEEEYKGTVTISKGGM